MIGDFVCSAASRILGPSVELHARGSRGGIFSDFVSLGCGASPVAASAAPAAARGYGGGISVARAGAGAVMREAWTNRSPKKI
jgi:hypothetical protein